MFDTVTIRPLIKAIGNNADLIVTEPSFDFKTKERSKEIILWRDGKKVISGAKMFCNNDHFNLTVKRNLNPYSSEQTVSLLQFSLPKQNNANNNETVKKESFDKALSQLYKNVFSAGFDIDIEASPVIRFDCATNVNTIINSKQFVNVFQFLDVPRMKKQVYDSSLLYFNKDTELNIYDKPREQGSIAKNQFSNVCRFELRNKTSKVCRSKYHVECFADLKKNFTEIRKEYLRNVQQKFFDTLKTETMIFNYNFADVMTYFKENSKRNFLQNAQNYFSFLYLNESGLIPDFINSCKVNNVSRNNLSILQKRFNKFMVLKKQFDSLKMKKNYFEYVADLQKEFLKAS